MNVVGQGASPAADGRGDVAGEAGPTATASNASGRHLVRHSSVSVLTSAVDAAGGLIVGVLIGRLLGERPTGQYGYAQALAGIVLSVCAMGLPSYVILSVAGGGTRWREISRNVFGVYLAVSLPLALVTVLAAYGVASGPLGPAGVVLPAVVSVFAAGFSGMVLACLQGLGDFRAGLSTSLATRTAAVGAILIIHWANGGIAAFLVALAGIQSVVAVLLAVKLGRLTHGLFSAPSARWLEHIRAALPFGALVVFELLYYRSDTVLLRWFKGDAETGFYVAAYAIYTVPILLATSVGAALFPWVVRRRAAGLSPRRAMISVSLVLLVFGLVAAVLAVLVGPHVIRLLYGTRFDEGGRVLTVLAFAIPLGALSRLGIISMKAEGRLRACIATSALAAVGAICANIFVIPAHGAMGAAGVTVATEALLFAGAAGYGAWSAAPPSSRT